MDSAFYSGNRRKFYEAMEPDSLLVLFSGEEVRKTNDEYYPFFADRNFVYLTGLTDPHLVLTAVKDRDSVRETLYIRPKDPMAERWNGARVSPREAEALSGVRDIRPLDRFPGGFHAMAAGGHYSLSSGRFARVYLDLFRVSPQDIDRPAHRFLGTLRREYPFLQIRNANAILRRLRLIKQPCEIEALRRAEAITGEGILAMMRASRPGLWEYQYKAEFDHALGQYGPAQAGFPPIISAGKNNFCIHYYAYTGQARDGDMILNDVGTQWDGLITDVSRGWPCNGKFSEQQRLLYECALATSDHMFSVIRPGMRMDSVDAEIRRYNAERLRDAGVLRDVSEIGAYMWHGGAHHIGFDVHDVVERPETVVPGMVFCVDVGIYHEAWGIGFRLEDNCLVTEEGCENLSAAIPRTPGDIEAAMGKR